VGRSPVQHHEHHKGPLQLPVAAGQPREHDRGRILRTTSTGFPRRPRRSAEDRRGEISSREDIAEGLENFPDTLLRLFSGENTGKLVLRSLPIDPPVTRNRVGALPDPRDLDAPARAAKRVAGAAAGTYVDGISDQSPAGVGRRLSGSYFGRCSRRVCPAGTSGSRGTWRWDLMGGRSGEPIRADYREKKSKRG